MIIRFGCVVACLVLSSIALGETIHVPTDEPTIQACIDASSDGDECVVAPGTYFEHVDFHGKGITLRSTDPDNWDTVTTTVIDGQGAGTVVTCENDEESDTVLDGLTITGGNASQGGGMYIDRSDPTIRRCAFVGNVASTGAGIYSNSGSPTVGECVFDNNESELNGGGLYQIGTSVIVTDTVFINNTALRGGGMYCAGAYLALTNSTFRLNQGGGLGSEFGTLEVANSSFLANHANRGSAGVDMIFSALSVTNCTFTGNTCSSFGCAVQGNTDSHVGITNSILWDSGSSVVTDVTAGSTISFSLVQGGVPAGLIDGGGNINADPRFVDADGADDILGTYDDDIRLQPGSLWPGSPLQKSPCIDAGDNAASELAGLTVDADSQARFADDHNTVDTGSGAAPIVDIGAYEYVAVARGNRYLRLSAPPLDGSTMQVLRVRIASLDGFVMPTNDVYYVGPPFAAPEENTSQVGQTFQAARLQCEPYVHDWSNEVVTSVYGGEIMPGSAYFVETAASDCPNLETDETCWSAPMTITTARYGDVVAPFYENLGDIEPSFLDISAVVKKFLRDPSAPIKAVAQVQPNTVFPDRPIDFKDINAYVLTFLGTAYAETTFATGPCLCPSMVTCDAMACVSDMACGGGFCIDGSCMDACGRCSP